MPSGSDVHLKNLEKSFGGVLAVDGVSLDVPRGAFVTLLGPSGCGKTTTLRMIGGFEQPDRGEVYIQGTPMGNTPPHARDTSMVFQSYALFPHMSVRDNIAFGLREQQVSMSEISKRVQDMLDLIELPTIGDRKPRELSGGQQQRIALARSLVTEPTVLLLDEPLGALDHRLRKQMQIELKRIQQRLGITFIYVTHDQEEALTMSDRIVVMRAGKVEQEGSAEDIFERPASRYVAEFMGAENVVPVQIDSHDVNSVSVRFAGRSITLPHSKPNCDALMLVIRPENVRLDADDGWQGTIIERVYKGSAMSYRIELTDGLRLIADVPFEDGARRLEVGDPVVVDFRASNATLVPGGEFSRL